MPRSLEAVRKAKREGMARLRAADPELARRKQQAWCAENRQRVREKNNAYRQRRFFWEKATKLRSKESASYVEIARLWRAQRGLCAITGRRLNRTAQLDHIVAKARGGSDSISNLRWVCPEINFAKRDMGDAEFAALIADCARWIGQRIEMVDALSASVQAA